MSEPAPHTVERTARLSRPLNFASLYLTEPVSVVTSSGVTPSLIPFSDKFELLRESLGEELQPFDVEFDNIARLFAGLFREIQDRYADTWTLIGSSSFATTELELGVEKEIVVRMSPLSSRDVKVRAKYMGRARPNVVFDLVSGE